MKTRSLVHKFTEQVLLYLAKGGFLKAVAKLSGATFLGQVVSILASLILTRLYTPADFGALGIFTAIASQLAVFVCMRYEWAILPAKDDKQAADLVFLCCSLSLATSIAVAFACSLYSNQIAAWVKLPTLARYLWLLPIATFSAGLFQIFNYWALRQKDFSVVAKAQVAKSLWSNGIQIGLGFLHLGALGLLIGYTVNQFAGLKALLFLFWKNGKQYLANYSIANITNAGRAYGRFVTTCLTSSFFNYAAISIPSILLASYYGEKEVGFFSLAQRITAIPAILISGAVSQVYFSNACELVRSNPQELRRLHARTSLMLFSISLLVVVVLFFAPSIVPTIFGKQWQVSGIMCQYMSPMLVTTLCVSPLTMLEWLDKNLEILVWNTLRFFCLVTGFYLSHYFHLSVEKCIGIFSLVTAICYGILFWMNRYAISQLSDPNFKI